MKTMNNNYRKIVVIGILGLSFYWLIMTFNIVISPLIIGAILAFLLDPVVQFVKRKLKTSHNAAAGLVFVFFISVIATSVWLLTPVVISQTKFLNQQFHAIMDEALLIQPALEETIEINIPLGDWIADLEYEIEQFSRADRLFRFMQTATSNFVWIAVILVTCFYLMRDWEKLREWVFSQFSTRSQKRVRGIYTEIKQVWDTYLRGQLVMMSVIGVLSSIGGAAVGLRNAILIGLLAGALALIPSLGPAIATIIAGAIAWTQGSAYLPLTNFWFMILVVGIFMSVQFAEGIWLYPQIMGKRMNLHPAIVFVAVVSSLAVLGALFGLIIVPIIGTVSIILRQAFKMIK